MKLNIDDLRVESYANQLSETELTELKGGVTPIGIGGWLTYVGVAAVVTAVGSAVVALINSESAANNDHKECDNQTTTLTMVNQDGSVTTIVNSHHICREKQ